MIDNTQNVTLELPLVPDGFVLTEVTGTVRIQNNPSLTDFGNAFQSLEAIGGALQVLDNPLLGSIDTFDALASLDGPVGFVVQRNGALTSIAGFNLLESVAGFFDVQDNGLLTELGGFASLTTISGDITVQGANLTSIEGLGSLTDALSELDILEPNGLSDLDQLTSLANVVGDCSIQPASLLAGAPANVQSACG